MGQRQRPSLAVSSASTLVLVYYRRDHRPHGLLEVASAVYGPVGIEPHGLMRGIDHGVRRAGQRLQGSHGESPIPSGVGLEIATVSFGDGTTDAINHALHLDGMS